MRKLLIAVAVLFLIAFAAFAQTQTSQPFDIIIRNGHIVDGTGSPWYSGDIGIRDGRIAVIGVLRNTPAKRVIDAQGKIVAPGFIDMLGQSELSILVEPRLPSKIYQGITTEVTGEGGSAAPLNDKIIAADHLAYEHYKVTPDWRDFRGYFARLEKHGIGINVADFAGATQVRRMVLGDDDRKPSPAELDQMRALVRQAMEQGAVGVSTSLQYAPAPYASTDELVALASEASKCGGIYASHMRSEGDRIMQALDEVARIGREGHIPVEIWHLKTAGKKNFGRMPQVIERINALRAEGIDLNADTYGYTAGANTLSAFLPPWVHDGGDEKMVQRLHDPAVRARVRREMLTDDGSWENEWQEITGPDGIIILGVQNPALAPTRGKTVAQIAKMWNKDPIDTIIDLVIEDKGFTSCAIFIMDQKDVDLTVEQPWVSFDNDAEGTTPEGLLGKDFTHPRAYGTFPRILRKYVREEHKLTLEDAIRKMSSLPAQRMRFTDRGVLRKGMWADVVIFDPATIADVATFENPHQFSKGMEYVLVNGSLVIDGGRMTGALPGKVLRGPGFASEERR